MTSEAIQDSTLYLNPLSSIDSYLFIVYKHDLDNNPLAIYIDSYHLIFIINLNDSFNHFDVDIRVFSLSRFIFMRSHFGMNVNELIKDIMTMKWLNFHFQLNHQSSDSDQNKVIYPLQSDVARNEFMHEIDVFMKYLITETKWSSEIIHLKEKFSERKDFIIHSSTIYWKLSKVWII